MSNQNLTELSERYCVRDGVFRGNEKHQMIAMYVTNPEYCVSMTELFAARINEQNSGVVQIPGEEIDYSRALPDVYITCVGVPNTVESKEIERINPDVIVVDNTFCLENHKNLLNRLLTYGKDRDRVCIENVLSNQTPITKDGREFRLDNSFGYISGIWIEGVDVDMVHLPKINAPYRYPISWDKKFAIAKLHFFGAQVHNWDLSTGKPLYAEQILKKWGDMNREEF